MTTKRVSGLNSIIQRQFEVTATFAVARSHVTSRNEKFQFLVKLSEDLRSAGASRPATVAKSMILDAASGRGPKIFLAWKDVVDSASVNSHSVVYPVPYASPEALKAIIGALKRKPMAASLRGE